MISRFKAIYQDYDWCYQKYIIEGLNHDEMAKEANCSKRVVEKWCVERHRLTQKYRQQNKTLNNIQHDLIIGSLLGDGHIDKRETQPVFIIVHAENQKDYLFWKYELVKDLCNTPPTKYDTNTTIFGDKIYTRQSQYRFCTRIYDCLIKYRELSSNNLVDNLNNFSLSIWMLDDGYRSESSWELCVASYNDNEREYIVDKLKNKFELDCKLKKDTRYITFTADSSRKLDNIILSIIPNDLDIIKYKIKGCA